MRDLGTVSIFRAGAVGAPGHRTFYLEVDDEWFLLEKEQVAVLAARALELLGELGVRPQEPIEALSEAGDPTFRVGAIEMGIGSGGVTIALSPGEDEDHEAVSFVVAPQQLDAMARRALLVVAAGRPPCPYCNLPRDPEGHVCPASNGDRRRA